ncbi:MAG: hypothetical protein MUC36_20190 [Planctomycetes bacterium]|nr:hypothetical protein [Planctomycetota bacterium]
MNMGRRTSLSLESWLLTTLALAAPLVGQCNNPWPVVLGSSGVEGTVSDTLPFDPDGPGPLTERLLVAGTFRVAGTVFAENLALYDPATRTWAPFGAGPYPSGLSLARAANGDLYAAGVFTSIAGVAAARIARWDGSSWSPLGAGLVGSNAIRVRALPTGIVVTGAITAAGGQPTAGIARWDGSSWSSLASTSLVAPIFGDVVELPNGDLAAGVQSFSAASNLVGVIRFDGTSWTLLGPLFPTIPLALTRAPSGELFAGGQSVAGGGLGRVARWNGTAWNTLSGDPFLQVTQLQALPNGLLAASGLTSFSNNHGVALWDGAVWTLLGEGVGSIHDLEWLAGGDLVAAGTFAGLGAAAALGLARWNGVGWSAASPGLAESTEFLAVRPDGSYFVAPRGGLSLPGLVRRWNGVSWQSIGGGFPTSSSLNAGLTGLFALPDGGLLAGGQVFSSSITGVPVLQRWNGSSSWSTLATATSGAVSAAAMLPGGELVVGGQFQALDGVPLQNVARRVGATWAPLGAGVAAPVQQLVVDPTGQLWARTANAVLRWTGTAWSQLGLAQPSATALVFGADGVPVLGGDFAAAGVLRWSGVSWVSLGVGPGGAVASLAVLPDGDLVAGPRIEPGGTARPLQRWDGVSWSPLGGAIDGTVFALGQSLPGDLLLVGRFTTADGLPRCRFARVSTSCPASVLSLAPQCGFSLQLTLQSQVLPWLGGTCRATVTGLPNDSLALLAFGTTGASIPLSSLLPFAGAACQLLVVPELLQLAVPEAGAVRTSFVVPAVPTLLGASVRQQALQLQFPDSGGTSQWLVTATNALVYTIGSF